MVADPALTTLRLSLSELRFGAAQSLAEALERNTILERLDLGQEEGIQETPRETLRRMASAFRV